MEKQGRKVGKQQRMIRPLGQGIQHCQNCFISGYCMSGARYEPAYHLPGQDSTSPEHTEPSIWPSCLTSHFFSFYRQSEKWLSTLGVCISISAQQTLEKSFSKVSNSGLKNMASRIHFINKEIVIKRKNIYYISSERRIMFLHGLNKSHDTRYSL